MPRTFYKIIYSRYTNKVLPYNVATEITQFWIPKKYILNNFKN